jgi:hypothetical protein
MPIDEVLQAPYGLTQLAGELGQGYPSFGHLIGLGGLHLIDGLIPGADAGLEAVKLAASVIVLDFDETCPYHLVGLDCGAAEVIDLKDGDKVAGRVPGAVVGLGGSSVVCPDSLHPLSFSDNFSQVFSRLHQISS